MLFVTNLTWNSFTSQNSKTHALFRQCFVWLRSGLHVQSRSIFQFSLNISTIKCAWNVHCAVKTVFPLFPAIFFELRITRTPDGSSFFRFPLKVPVIGSRLYMNTNKTLALWQHCPFCIGEWLTWPIIHQPEDARYQGTARNYIVVLENNNSASPSYNQGPTTCTYKHV